MTSAGRDYFQSLISAIARAMPDTSLLIAVHGICSGTVHRTGVLADGRCEDPLDSIAECVRRSLSHLLLDHSLCKEHCESHVMNQHNSIVAKPTPATLKKVLEILSSIEVCVKLLRNQKNTLLPNRSVGTLRNER